MATTASCVGVVVSLLVVFGASLTSAYEYRNIDQLPDKARRDSVDVIVFQCSGLLSECARDHLKLDKACTLVEKVVKSTARDTVTRRYDVWCAGYKIMNAVVTVEADKDGTNTYSLYVAPDALATFKPRQLLRKLNPADALSMAANAFGISASNYRAHTMDHDVKQVWFYDGEGFRLCALASFGYDLPGNMQHPHILVDVETKQAIKHWDGIGRQQLEYITSAPAYFPAAIGNPGTTGYKTGVNILTVGNASIDFTNMTLPPYYTVQSYEYTNAIVEPIIILETYNILACPSSSLPYNQQTNCYFSPMTSTMYAAEHTWKMYLLYMGEYPSIGTVTFKVLYGPNSTNSFTYIQGTSASCSFGGGAGFMPYFSLTSLDVICHEVSHVFTARHSNLPMFGQTYGINEAYSDIAAQALQYYLFNSSDYCLGSRIARQPGLCLRYMCNPPQDNSSIANISNYTPNMDGHYSSGIFNKAYCLISKSAGYTPITAWLPFAYANVNRWYSSSTFVSAACDVYYSARVYLTYNATMLAAIKSGFTAVGITIGSTC